METIVYFTPWHWQPFTYSPSLQHINPFFWLLLLGGSLDAGGLSGGFQSLNGGFE